MRGGLTYGATDEFGYRPVENAVHRYDLHATILHTLGFDHERLTHRHADRDFRLTDVEGRVVHGILAWPVVQSTSPMGSSSHAGREAGIYRQAWDRLASCMTFTPSSTSRGMAPMANSRRQSRGGIHAVLRKFPRPK